MAVRLLRWQGPKRTERCRQYLQSVIAAWLADWSAVPVGEVMLALLAPGEHADLDWRRARSERGAVLLGLPVGGLAACGSSLLGLGAAHCDSIRKHVASEAIADLMQRLCGVADSKVSKAVEVLEHEPADVDFAECHGNLGFRLDDPFTGVRLVVDADWCDRFVPILHSNVHPPLIARRSAIADTLLQAKATIELGALSISDSIGLSVGEVLLTDARTDAAAFLNIGDRMLATGNLSNNKDRRALRLTGLIASQTK